MTPGTGVSRFNRWHELGYVGHSKRPELRRQLGLAWHCLRLDDIPNRGPDAPDVDSFQNTRGYQYYRLNITKTRGGGLGSLGELVLWADDVVLNTPPELTPFPIAEPVRRHPEVQHMRWGPSDQSSRHPGVGSLLRKSIPHTVTRFRAVFRLVSRVLTSRERKRVGISAPSRSRLVNGRGTNMETALSRVAARHPASAAGRIIAAFTSRMRTAAIARRFDILPGRVSQLRRNYEHLWHVHRGGSCHPRRVKEGRKMASDRLVAPSTSRMAIWTTDPRADSQAEPHLAFDLTSNTRVGTKSHWADMKNQRLEGACGPS